MPDTGKQKTVPQKAGPPPGVTPARVLARTVSALTAIERGVSLQEARESGSKHRILQNTLLTILRHQAVLDWTMDQFAAAPPRPRLRRVLRWGLSQILYMRGVAGPVVNDVCVEYV